MSPTFEKTIRVEVKIAKNRYGKVHFRSYEDEEIDKQSKPYFKTTFPPILVFERFGKEYIPRYTVYWCLKVVRHLIAHDFISVMGVSIIMNHLK